MQNISSNLDKNRSSSKRKRDDDFIVTIKNKKMKFLNEEELIKNKLQEEIKEDESSISELSNKSNESKNELQNISTLEANHSIVNNDSIVDQQNEDTKFESKFKSQKARLSK